MGPTTSAFIAGSCYYYFLIIIYKYIPHLLQFLFLKCPVQGFKAHWWGEKMKLCSFLSHLLTFLFLWIFPSPVITHFSLLLLCSLPTFRSYLKPQFLLSVLPHPFPSSSLWFCLVLPWGDLRVTLQHFACCLFSPGVSSTLEIPPWTLPWWTRS